MFKDFTIILESMNFSLNEPIEYHELNFIIHQSSIVKLLDKMNGQLKKNKWAFIWHNSQANLLIGVCIVFKLFCCFSSYWCCTFWIMFKSYEWLWTKFGTILILRCLWFGLNKNGFRSSWVWNESSWSAKISYELNDREFSVKTTPPLLRGPITFSPLVHFCRFLVRTDTPRGGLHLLFEHHRQWDILARIARKPYLKCSDTGQSSLVDISIMCQKQMNWKFSRGFPSPQLFRLLPRSYADISLWFVDLYMVFSCVCSAGIQSCQASFSTTASEFSIAASVRLKGSSFLLHLRSFSSPSPSSLSISDSPQSSANIFFATDERLLSPLHALLWKIKISVLGSCCKILQYLVRFLESPFHSRGSIGELLSNGVTSASSYDE